MRVENKICFTVRLYQKKKKQQAFFLLTEAEVAEIKMTTKTEADAFKQSNHVSLESFWTLSFCLRAIFRGTPREPHMIRNELHENIDGHCQCLASH